MTDVTIKGAGILGLSIAWACVARGASVQVIDPHGVAAGSSGGIVGALAPHVPENWNPKKQFQLESLLMARRFWADVEEVGSAPSGYLSTGRLQPLADDHAVALAQTRCERARALWGDAARWEVTDRPPDSHWCPPSASGHWVYDTLSAHLHPRQACHALAAALARKGVTVAADGADNGPVIWAAGWAGLKELNAGRARPPGAGVKGQAALFGLDRAGQPQLFADALHIVPHADGTVAIGSTSENSFDDPTSTDAQLETLISKARGLVPALADAPVIARWAGVRPRARSRAPMLGPWPDRPGQFIANGGFKIGFGMAPKIGEVTADLVLDGRTTFPDDFAVTASL
ncbi:MAG: FAD-binding oxidoreductase [Rhodobacteraceae bacterium]|nr:FAD-binding oxidoreductase [Paracoccaceae bacterium]